MSATSTVYAAVVLPGGEVVPARVEVILDQSWSPYVQATATIPYTGARAALLEPRQSPPPRVHVVVRRSWYDAPILDDLTRAWGDGLTLADLTPELTGLTLDGLSDGWITEWDSGRRAPDELTADLSVRGRSISRRDDTITIRLASDELLVQGARVIITRPVEPLPARIAALLTAAGVDVSRLDLAAGAIFTAMPALELDLSRSVWDEASSAASSTGLRLWCGPDRTWHLTDVNAALAGTVDLGRVIDADEATDLDGDWADALAITCTWTMADGTTRTTQTRTWPDPIPAGAVRVVHERLDVSVPGDSWPGPTEIEMAARLTRMQAQGRVQTLTAPIDPTVRPGLALATGAPSLPITTAAITAVTFRVPEDTMTLTANTTQDA